MFMSWKLKYMYHKTLIEMTCTPHIDNIFFQTHDSFTCSPHLMSTQNSVTMAGWSLTGWGMVSPGKHALDWNAPWYVGRSSNALGQSLLRQGAYVHKYYSQKLWHRSSCLEKTWLIVLFHNIFPQWRAARTPLISSWVTTSNYRLYSNILQILLQYKMWWYYKKLDSTNSYGRSLSTAYVHCSMSCILKIYWRCYATPFQ